MSRGRKNAAVAIAALACGVAGAFGVAGASRVLSSGTVHPAPAHVPVRLAVIGGSGLYDLEALKGATSRTLETPYGPPSSPLRVGRVGRLEVAFLARHGVGHVIPPHRVNHRANLYWSSRNSASTFPQVACRCSSAKPLPSLARRPNRL